MTAAQEGYLARADENLEAARLLAGSGLPGIAIGRAYYAMFHAAQAALVGLGLTYSKHSAVVSAFGQHVCKPGLVSTHLHRYLVDAAQIRVRADYTVGHSFTDEMASELIARAEELVAAVREYLA